MCDKIKVFKLHLNTMERIQLHLYLITVLTKVIAIIFVFENFIAFVIVFKYYAMYLDPSMFNTIAIICHYSYMNTVPWVILHCFII